MEIGWIAHNPTFLIYNTVMKYITLLLKPASSKCQMRCKYCFYFDEIKCRDIDDYGFMSIETAKSILDKVFTYFKEETTITVLFQGGEPTLVGIDWFNQFIAYVNSTHAPYHHIQYGIQTNGICIDNAWIQLFKQHHFLVGLSMDGYKENHDSFRFLANMDTTFQQVLHTYHQLIKNDIQVNVLTVLTNQLAKSPKQFYRFIQKENIKWLQLIPCLPSLQEEDSYALSPKAYAFFMKNIFDLWFQEYTEGIYRAINTIDDILSVFQKRIPMQCGKLGFCTRQFVIEADGSVFPCDFYCIDQWKLGNFLNNTFEEIADARKAKYFIESQKQNHVFCKSCRYKNICNGGCPRQASTYLEESFCGQQQLFQHIEKCLYQK